MCCKIKSNKGFTLIESIAVMCILSIISICMFKIYSFGFKSYDYISTQVYKRSNIRIATQFIYDRIKNSNEVVCQDNVLIDGKFLYIKKNILRYNTDSQQIADGIDSFKILKINKDIYEIKVKSGKLEYNTFVKRRNSI